MNLNMYQPRLISKLKFVLYFFPFPGLFFIIFLIFAGLGLRLGFWGWCFQLMGFGACGVGPSGFVGLGLSI